MICKNQTEITSICTYLCTVFTELLQYKEVKLWFEIDWNGGSKMVLRLQVPKIVPKNETLVTKRHIEIPKGSGQKYFVLERSNLKKSNQNLSQKINSQIKDFLHFTIHQVAKTTAWIFQKVCLPSNWEKKVYVEWCPRVV